MNKIVALVGMPGTGKSVVSDFFKVRGFALVYFGGVTMEEIEKRGLELNEKNEKLVREQLRKELGMAAYAIKNIPKIEEALKHGNVIVDGLYSWSEYKVLKEKFGDLLKVLAIVSPMAARHVRLAGRKVRPLNEAESTARDYAEIENLEKGGPIANADNYVVNDGTIKDLIGRLEKLYGRDESDKEDDF